MKRFALFFLALVSTTACGADPCEDAVDKLDECGFADELGVGDGECSELIECQASCIADASCDEIEAFLEDDSGFASCLDDCQGEEL